MRRDRARPSSQVRRLLETSGAGSSCDRRGDSGGSGPPKWVRRGITARCQSAWDTTYGLYTDYSAHAAAHSKRVNTPRGPSYPLGALGVRLVADLPRVPPPKPRTRPLPLSGGRAGPPARTPDTSTSVERWTCGAARVIGGRVKRMRELWSDEDRYLVLLRCRCGSSARKHCMAAD